MSEVEEHLDIDNTSSSVNENVIDNKNAKRRRTRKKSSRIWDHFEIVENSSVKTGYIVVCQHCNWRVQYSRASGSSGCNKHTLSSSCPYFSKYPGLGNTALDTSNNHANNVSQLPNSPENGSEGLVRVAAIQMSCSENRQENIDKAINMVHNAARQGAKIVLLQELFETLYFCQEQSGKYFSWAHEVHIQEGETLEISQFSDSKTANNSPHSPLPEASSPIPLHQASSSIDSSVDDDKNIPLFSTDNNFLDIFARLAKELHIVLPVSFFEKANNAFFNTVIVFDANGMCLGKYRKSHIPDGPGYQEKYYFSPGDTGFKVFSTTYGKIGVGICWDQWFPEAARAMALQGADLILYPTAIGSEPTNPSYDSSRHWERVMVGHSAANMVPIVVANRVGIETFPSSSITFYGSSFITNHLGEIISKADRSSDSVLIGDIDLSKAAQERIEWGLFRDRRPELYSMLLTKDGSA